MTDPKSKPKPKPARVADPAPAPAPYHVLAPGDAVVPAVLHGTHCIPVPDIEEDLRPPTAPTAAQLYAASARSRPPSWLERYPAYVAAEWATLLADLGPIGSNDSYTFDLEHRLDEVTFVGQPVGARVPVLGLRFAEEVWADASGEQATLRLRTLHARKQGPHADALSLSLRDLGSFGPPWSEDAHVPALLLEERYRLVSLELETSVGALAGTLTLLPGERRTIRISATSERKSTAKSSRSVVEDASDETKDDFTSDFDRNAKRTSKSGSTVTWSAAPPGKDLPSPHVRQQSWSVEEMVDVTEKTVRHTTQTRKTSSQVKVSRDTEDVDSSKVEGSRTVEIFNPSSQCLTLAYHHLNTAYRTHLDLAELRLVYTGDDASAEAVTLRLDDLEASLREVVGDGAAAARAYAAVMALLEARYADRGIGKVKEGRFVFEAPPDDDPNDRLDSREALLAPDPRREGALPLRLSTRTHVVQRDTLHAVPHLSEFAIPEALIAKPKTAADAAAGTS